MTESARPEDAGAPRIVDVVTDDEVVRFVVVVAGAARDAPRVSVRPVGGPAGSVDVTGVEERGRDGEARRVAFACEAERGGVAYGVSVVVDRPGQALLTLPGPPVPARGAGEGAPGRDG
jgi:hypothetical protein